MKKTLIFTLAMLFLASCSEKKTHTELATEWVQEFFDKQSGGKVKVKSVKLDSLVKNGTEGYFTVVGKEAEGDKPMSVLLLYFNKDGTLNDKLNNEIYSN